MPTRKRIPPAERLRKHAPVGEPDECWEWKAKAKHAHGYGIINLGTGEGTMLAHRLAFTLANGPIPAGVKVLHRCDNPPCTNPAHLFLGSQADNMHDMADKGRASRGEDHHGRKLVADDVRWIRMVYARGRYTQPELARRFGVRQSAISGIVNHRLWRHIDPVPEMPHTGSLKGEAHRNAMFLVGDVLRIRALVAAGKAKKSELAEEYCVAPRTIRDIVNRVTWRHI